MREETERKNRRIKLKIRTMYRKGPARLHAFGSGDYEEFQVSDLCAEDQKNIRAMFPNKTISYEELSEYVFHKLKDDKNMLIGDIVFIATPYTSRPYYGFGVIYFDEKNNEKSIGFNEGYPYNIEYKGQIEQLQKNNVTYDDINAYQSIMPAFPMWSEWAEMWNCLLYTSDAADE